MVFGVPLRAGDYVRTADGVVRTVTNIERRGSTTVVFCNDGKSYGLTSITYVTRRTNGKKS
jgi:hypothetical protein